MFVLSNNPLEAQLRVFFKTKAVEYVPISLFKTYSLDQELLPFLNEDNLQSCGLFLAIHIKVLS